MTVVVDWNISTAPFRFIPYIYDIFGYMPQKDLLRLQCFGRRLNKKNATYYAVSNVKSNKYVSNSNIMTNRVTCHIILCI